MKPLRVSQDIVPMAEFKRQAAHWFRRAAENNQPVVITQNGRPPRILLSRTEFDRFVERHRFLEGVATGTTDLDAGRVVTTDELRCRLVFARARLFHVRFSEVRDISTADIAERFYSRQVIFKEPGLPTLRHLPTTQRQAVSSSVQWIFGTHSECRQAVQVVA